MLSVDELNRIEEEAVDAYYEAIDPEDFYDEEVIDYYDERIDVDRYRSVRGRCVIPGSQIYDWLYESFFVYDYLRGKYNKKYKSIWETADEATLSDRGTFYDYCTKFCDKAKDVWEKEDLPERKREYFLEHAEEDDS